MPFNPADIKNPYERAFKTWKWLIENYEQMHPSETTNILGELEETYTQFNKAFEIAWKTQITLECYPPNMGYEKIIAENIRSHYDSLRRSTKEEE